VALRCLTGTVSQAALQERPEENDNTSKTGDSFVAVINLEEGRDSSQLTFSAKTLRQALCNQAMPFTFKMCNPEEKKMQIAV